MPTVSVENYLKAILYLHEEGKEQVSTTELAGRVQATPASTSAMLRKLGERAWVEHRPYRGVRLTEEGGTARCHSRGPLLSVSVGIRRGWFATYDGTASDRSGNHKRPHRG